MRRHNKRDRDIQQPSEHIQSTVSDGPVTPDALRASIREAIDRQASCELGALLIDVDSGRVTLYGTVHSWREREAVVRAVTGTRGVTTVVDRLRIA